MPMGADAPMAWSFGGGAAAAAAWPAHSSAPVRGFSSVTVAVVMAAAV